MRFSQLTHPARAYLLTTYALAIGLVQVGGMEPGLICEPGKIKHLDLTGMDNGHAETSESGVE